MDKTKNKYSSEAVHGKVSMCLQKGHSRQTLRIPNLTMSMGQDLLDKLKHRLSPTSNTCVELVCELSIQKFELRRIGNGRNKT